MANRLYDGFPAMVTMADFPNFAFYIKDVTVPAVTGGGPLDRSWMGTVGFRRATPKKLKAIGPMTLIGAYKTDIFDPTTGMYALINHNQLFTIKYADDAETDMWMYVNDWSSSTYSEKEMEEANATLVVIFTGINNSDVEVDPVFRAAP